MQAVQVLLFAELLRLQSFMDVESDDHFGQRWPLLDGRRLPDVHHEGGVVGA